MQRSAAIASEAQMWSRNARETTGLDAMKAKAKIEVGEVGSIHGYCFFFLDLLGDRGVKLRNGERVDGCTYFMVTVTGQAVVL
jgi:hypothetical protein